MHKSAEKPPAESNRLSGLAWLGAAVPLVLLAGLIALFAWSGLGDLTPAAAPVEEITFEKVVLRPGEIIVKLRNTGPAEATIAHAVIDGAVWEGRYDPSPTIPRLGSTTLRLDYPWVSGEAHEIKLITTNSVIFIHDIPVAAESPAVSWQSVKAFGIIGVYVGVVPIGLGLLWFPFLRRTGKATIQFVLALTVGLLAFLLVDTTAEGFEMALEMPGVFRGIPLFVLGGLMSLMLLIATGGAESSGPKAGAGAGSARTGLRLAYLIALGIGLHNLGEGLAIGTAYATGQASLGTFLVIGFTLHNITEGVGIAAPILTDQPSVGHFVRLALLAGVPAILGTWLGAYAQSAYLAALFFGVGAGAIAQVIYEVGKLLLKEREAQQWVNLTGFGAGVAVMYLTALLVP